MLIVSKLLLQSQEIEPAGAKVKQVNSILFTLDWNAFASEYMESGGFDDVNPDENTG